MTPLLYVLAVTVVIMAVVIVALTARVLNMAEKHSEVVQGITADFSRGVTELNRESVMAVERVSQIAMDNVSRVAAPTPQTEPGEGETQPQDLWSATNDGPDAEADWSASDPWLDPSRDPNFVGGLQPGEEIVPGVPRPDMTGEEA